MARRTPARTSKRLAERVRRRGGKKALAVFVIANLALGAAATWWFTRPEDVRQAALDRMGPGVGRRATLAGIAFGLLVVLAIVVLPGARAAIAALARAQHWLRTRPMALRILLFPIEALVGLAWFLAQCLFAVDAIAIVASAAAFLLYVVRIAKPELFTFLPG
jgi:hypothetical protein